MSIVEISFDPLDLNPQFRYGFPCLFSSSPCKFLFETIFHESVNTAKLPSLKKGQKYTPVFNLVHMYLTGKIGPPLSEPIVCGVTETDRTFPSPPLPYPNPKYGTDLVDNK